MSEQDRFRKPIFDDVSIGKYLETVPLEDLYKNIASILSMYQDLVELCEEGVDTTYKESKDAFDKMERLLIPYLQREDINLLQENRYLPIEEISRLKEQILSRKRPFAPSLDLDKGPS